MGGLSLLPLTLGVTSPARRGETKGRTTDVAEAPPSVFERDAHTCRYCGFVSRRWHEVHAVSGRWEEDMPVTDPGEGVTACFLCHQVHHLDVVGEMKSGRLIWLPEIGQAALHHILRAVWLSQQVVGEPRIWAQTVLGTLEGRAQEARLRLGTDDPGVLADVFTEMIEDLGRKGFDERRGQFAGVRLLPEKQLVRDGKDVFGLAVTFWRSPEGPYNGRMPKTWLDTLEAAMAKLGG